uniref:Rod shape-determining protein RodA n=1 Tax=Thermodesulfobacterium geofontis TaxID=1295609 RepID=A0A7V5XG30_9BACT
MKVNSIKEIFRENFWGLFVVFILAILGILNQWIIAETTSILWKNLFWHLVGLISLIFLAFLIDYRKIPFNIVWYSYLVLILILLILFFLKKRWIDFGFISFQPSEFIKPILVLLISLIASKEPNPYLKLKTLAKLILIILIPLILIFPTDVDYAFIMVIMFISFLIFIGIPRKILFSLIFIGLLVIFLVSPIIWKNLKPHQKGRIYGYLHPEKYAQTWSYQLNQSLIAIGSGGLWGQGIKGGWSTRLHYLPAKYTDLAFAVWAETWGFIGVNLVLFLYGYLLYFCIKISSTAKDWLGKYLALGVGLILFWQALFNLGGCSGIFPMTSIPFPFLSYGGSVTISLYFLLSLMFNVAFKRHFFK